MEFKKKWKDNAEDILLELLDKVHEIISPVFAHNGKVDLLSLDKKGDLGFLVSLILNNKLGCSINFGADHISIIQLEVEDNKFLKYWGKINWLSIPSNHECHNSYQDPFYGLFKLEDDHLELIEAMFGDYDKKDLDNQYWIFSEMNWMYDL